MDPTVEELLLQRAAAGFPIPARRRHGLPAPIRELHRRVLGHFAATGELAGAYPFVANPRGHQVHLTGGLTVQAYCAIDALGIPAMLDQDATITSTTRSPGCRSPSRSATAAPTPCPPAWWSAT